MAKTKTKAQPKTSKRSALVSLTAFDSGGIGVQGPNVRIRQVWAPQRLDQAPVLDIGDYRPRGGTPLNDAVLRTIGEADAALVESPADVHVHLLLDESGSMGPLQADVVNSVNEFIGGLRDEEATQEGKVIVVIQTDGGENSSVEDPHGTKVKASIAQHEARGWTFIYLGAVQDAWGGAAAVGVTNHAHTLQTVPTSHGHAANAAYLRGTVRSRMTMDDSTFDTYSNVKAKNLANTVGEDSARVEAADEEAVRQATKGKGE